MGRQSSSSSRAAEQESGINQHQRKLPTEDPPEETPEATKIILRHYNEQINYLNNDVGSSCEHSHYSDQFKSQHACGSKNYVITFVIFLCISFYSVEDIQIMFDGKSMNVVLSTTSFTGSKFTGNGSSSRKSNDNNSNKNDRRRNLPRGSSGRWILDFNYSERQNYENYGSYSNWHIDAQNFIPSPEQPHRLAASYKWVDDSLPVIKNDGTAVPGFGPLREISVNEFCLACYKLNVTRIISLGDSLSEQFKLSLISLLGFQPQGRAATNFNAHLRPVTIRCSTTSQTQSFEDIQVLWMRRSALNEVLSLSSEGKCATEESFIKNNPKKTAIVANFGAWLQTKNEFEQAFESFLSWIDTSPMAESNEKLGPIFFRETIPGHFPCKPGGHKDDIKTHNWKVPVIDAPFENFIEYKNFSTSKVWSRRYQWNEFESYNEYARERLLNRSKLVSSMTTGQQNMMKPI